MSKLFCFSPQVLFWPLIFLKLWLFAVRAQTTDIGQLIKRKSFSDIRSVENILDKRWRIDVQPAQANGVERVMRFVNVDLHCIVSNLKYISKFSMFPSPGKISADVHANKAELFASERYHTLSTTVPALVLSIRLSGAKVTDSVRDSLAVYWRPDRN